LLENIIGCSTNLVAWNRIDLTDRYFGRLKALFYYDSYKPYGHARVRWFCECACGNFKVIEGRDLRSGDVRSCGCLRRKKEKNTEHRIKTNEEVFIENSTYSRGGIKSRILKQNLIPYQCSICGMESFWNDKPLALILDHINGINNDHRLENLRFICGNCDSQLSTYKARNRGNEGDKFPIRKRRTNY
jgi:5-methylcytosine-specific restriction endonuclease McrA